MSDWVNHVRAVALSLQGRWTTQPHNEYVLVTGPHGKIRARPMNNQTRVEWHVDPTLYEGAFPAVPVPINKPAKTFGVKRNTGVGRTADDAAAELVNCGLVAAAERAITYMRDVQRYLTDRHDITVANANNIAKHGNGRVYEDAKNDPGAASVDMTLAGYSVTIRVYGNDVIVDKLILPAHVAEQVMTVIGQMT